MNVINVMRKDGFGSSHHIIYNIKNIIKTMFETNGYWTCPNHPNFKSIDISTVKEHETYWNCKCIFHIIDDR